MKLDSIFQQIRDLIQKGGGVKFSFGDPSRVGDMSIIPVARVSFGFGGGGGKAANSKKKKQNENVEKEAEPKSDDDAQFGGGGGGGIKTDPVGIYAIKGDRVRFYPIVTVHEIVGIFSFVAFLLFRIGKLRRKKR
ncbi:MAG: hypothetical protein LHW64_02160 [Candidatus Cloacimonetes bacterium]|nr:hypothetical protein [Candidatus Cloacimonadota bacterium]MDY0228913.1 spore germination protein GerW family protein [Candidatus Cloacimonadaceae bacterium]